MPESHDCLIIGAGPAGLTAATYLARFHRRTALVDAGHSRARWIPDSHNCPGFPLGVSGRGLLQRMREQAEGYGVAVTAGRIVSLQRDGDGFIARDDHDRDWQAATVILASGLVDRMPALDGGDAILQTAIDAGVLRLCAVCDGYEASDERIAVYAPADDAIHHALFLRTFSRRVDAIRSQPGDAGADCRRQADAARVSLLPVPVRLHCSGSRCRAEFANGSARDYDTLYPVLGGDVQSQLARALGARLDDEGALQVDAHQQTSIDGLYAIGDVVSALNQIAVAVGHAALAATAVHNRLPRNFREDRRQQPATAAELPHPGTD